MDFYLNVKKKGNKLLVRDIQDGIRKNYEVKYEPYLFVKSNKGDEKYQSIYGQPAKRIDFDNMWEAKKFSEQYEDVEGFDVFGMTDFQYPFMNDKWKGTIEYDASKINIVSLDIETMSDSGFPNIETADKALTVVTISNRKQYVVIGIGPFDVSRYESAGYIKDLSQITYINCADERELLQTLLTWIRRFDPDVYTGWNIDGFDMPYLYRRIKRVLGDTFADQLSPWGTVQEKIVGKGEDVRSIFKFDGVATLDYLDVYKKFTLQVRESYKLDAIAELELDAKKLDYDEYDSLHDFYMKNYQRYVEYNIRDTELIELLEEKLGFIELIFAIAFDAKVNFEDALTSVKLWDVIIHNYLIQQNIVVPQRQSVEDRSIVGGYVKDPQIGEHHWVVSCDLNSLYPSLIAGLGISPENLMTRKHFEQIRGMISEDDELSEIVDQLIEHNATHATTVDTVLNGQIDERYRRLCERFNLCIAPSGKFFRRDRRGFLGDLMVKFYDERKAYKKKMLEEKDKFQQTGDPKHKALATRYDKIQGARKVQLNSAYGALANKYFRFYNPDLAESVTKSGQMSIRWIENELNGYLNKNLKTENKDYIIASDTDSVYLVLDGLVNKVYKDKSPTTTEIVDYLDKVCEQILEPRIDKGYQKLADYIFSYEQKMKMKREVIANKGVWTGKKYYILNVHDDEGVRLKEPSLKIMGISAVKSSTPSSCRDAIKGALKVVMNGTNDELIQYIDKFRKDFKELPYDKIAFPRGVNGVQKYTDTVHGYRSGTPIQVRAAIIYNREIKARKLTNNLEPVRDGDKIKFAYLREPNPTFENVIGFHSTIPKGFEDIRDYIDYNTQFEKAFLKAVRDITDKIGWEVEKKSTLDAFFG